MPVVGMVRNLNEGFTQLRLVDYTEESNVIGQYYYKNFKYHCRLAIDKLYDRWCSQPKSEIRPSFQLYDIRALTENERLI